MDVFSLWKLIDLHLTCALSIGIFYFNKKVNSQRLATKVRWSRILEVCGDTEGLKIYWEEEGRMRNVETLWSFKQMQDSLVYIWMGLPCLSSELSIWYTPISEVRTLNSKHTSLKSTENVQQTCVGPCFYASTISGSHQDCQWLTVSCLCSLPSTYSLPSPVQQDRVEKNT